MALQTQSDLGALARGLGVQMREIFDQTLDTYRPSWEPVVRTITDDGAAANFSGKTGVGTLVRFADHTPIPKANRFKIFDTQFAHDQYGKQIEVSRMMIMNREMPQVFDEFKDLTISAQATKSKAPAQIFNRGFTSGNGTTNQIVVTVYNDGKALFSGSHPRADGGSSQSNTSTTSIALSESNFETARVQLLEQLQDDGNPVQVTGDIWLVVPPALEKTARIITESDQRSGTANNDINIYSGGGYPVMSSNWLGASTGGTDDAWYLVAPSMAKIMLVLRNDVSLDSSVDRASKAVLFDVIVDYSVGSAHWIGTWGSKGDASSYTG